ncbi:MAG TPA: stage II sporulation protein M [Actinomycetales bacterium]|nr:stage II sporulation protein M [Actinomycetales bacterium]
MDLEAFVAVHRDEWDELERLLRRRRVDGAEVDRLVLLYQRTATHLSAVRSSVPDPVLISRLSTLVARARARLTGSHESAWRDLARFAVVSFPAALWRIRWWWTAVTAACLLVAFLSGAWVVGDPAVQASFGSDAEIRQLVGSDFENYYSEDPASSFAARVWTNNAWIAAQCVAFGVTGFWNVWVLWQNALNIGAVGGLMVANGRGDLFFGLILPHGLLELTAVFVAGAAGLKLFWAWVDPGARPRATALAQEGRALFTVALGLVVVLAVSGVIEAFVTPSPLPTWARIAIGVIALAAFGAYAALLGRRAVRAGETGDLSEEQAGAVRPVAG